MALFVIVGKNEPVYEAELGAKAAAAASAGHQSQQQQQQQQDETAHLNQFIVHSSLDMLEKAMWTNNMMNLRAIDRFNGQSVHAFLTAGGTALMLLHDGSKSDDAIHSFFKEAYELYVKLIMNPFFEFDKPIVSPAFDARIRQLEKRYLR